MTYHISESEFTKNFNLKSLEEKGADSLRITHTQDQRFKLFPYKASGKSSSPIVTDLKEIVGDFIKDSLNIQSSDTSFELLWKQIIDEVDMDEHDTGFLKDIIYSTFYEDDKFVANTIGLYAYQGSSSNKSAERIATFLHDVLDIGDLERVAIQNAMEHYSYNALEKLVTESVEKLPTNLNGKDTAKSSYFCIFEDAAVKFKNDFQFILSNGMSSPDDLADLFSLYYFYYTAQSCITLDQFGNGDRNRQVPLYFALDWEKVSANRKCCTDGWKKLQQNVGNIFSHAVTLELINQTDDASAMYDYKKLADAVSAGELEDHDTAEEIHKIERLYTDAVGDYRGFSSIPFEESKSETDEAMRHLFACVKAQFQNTDRKRANDFYVEKLSAFYRSRWLKNRKKAGLVLNLTESDIIFLTKISIQGKERIRLVDLFKEYEIRGVYLDNTSKTLLQAYFTRLNLLDKKSDSGDAQYVKRIL